MIDDKEDWAVIERDFCSDQQQLKPTCWAYQWLDLNLFLDLGDRLGYLVSNLFELEVPSKEVYFLTALDHTKAELC